jgi:hypothetical protein
MQTTACSHHRPDVAEAPTTAARVRFADAREVFAAFPTACEDIATPPTEAEPLQFLRALASGPAPQDAIGFCAYLLPRREAVWWASQCVRTLLDQPSERDEAALRAAEDWVYEPEEPTRQAALQIGMAADRRAPSTWVALAAAWSGGTLVVSEHDAARAPSHLTARAARGAVMLALAGKPDQAAHVSWCAEYCAQIAAEQ